jgi:putative flippase GtrA
MDTTAHPVADRRPAVLAAPVLELVIPVHDEERDLERAVRTARAFLDTQLPYPARLTIADNASSDGTWAIARRLADELPGVRALHLDAKGRGRALQAAWGASDASVLAYMDVDLSTDLSGLAPLVAPLVSGHAHVAIGTRLARSARVVRGPRRELISRCYNVLLRGTLGVRFSDAQCGFKAIRADAARLLLPLVADTQWFFDTELLVLAEKAGLRVDEVPVDWVDDPDSRVDVVATARADLRGIARLARALAAGRLPLGALRGLLPLRSDGAFDAPAATRTGLVTQLVRFAVVGVASTLAYALLYVALAGPLGTQAANLVALLVTAVANTAANRAYTFGVRGRARVVRHQGQGLAVFALAWALTSGSLAALHALAPGASRLVELVVLCVANLAATVLRFVLLRGWVFRAGPTTNPSAAAATTATAPAAAGSRTEEALR